jgi:hypothetical protein
MGGKATSHVITWSRAITMISWDLTTTYHIIFKLYLPDHPQYACFHESGQMILGWIPQFNMMWPQDRQVGLLTTTTFGSVDVQLGISQPLQVRHFPSISTKVCGDGADSGQGGARGPPPPPLIAVLRAQCNDAIRTLEFARDVTSTDPADKDPSLRTADVATCNGLKMARSFFSSYAFRP